jgi:tetraacyldisaccharide 4'-kinase
MRRWLELLEEFAIEVIMGRAKGKRAALLRGFLYSLSHLYRKIVGLRLWLYRKRIMRESTAGVLVISIGNLTVGGTGKTPVVEKFARTLQEGGRRVAILTRGYKSKKLPLLKRWIAALTNRGEYQPRIVSDGRAILLDSRMAGDEPYMLAVNLENVIVLVDKNRIASAHYAVEKMGCDTLILDDGMQYVKLKHRLEVCLVDAQAPFGNEYLLPRGTLREPPENLRRATVIFITKSPAEGNAELIARIRKYNRTAEIIECRHRPVHLEHAYTGEIVPLDWLKGRHLGVLSGIAQPASFESSLKKLGAKIDYARHFADHHRFSHREIESVIARCIRRDLDAILTTEKDSVRLPRIPDLEKPIYFLRVEIEILSGHESWEALVNRICLPQPLLEPERFYA